MSKRSLNQNMRLNQNQNEPLITKCVQLINNKLQDLKNKGK